MELTSLLRLERLVKTFRIGRFPRMKTVWAVNGVDLDVAPLEVVSLVGESGSGKSTFARVVARLEVPTSGRILLEGRELPRRMPYRALAVQPRLILAGEPTSMLDVEPRPGRRVRCVLYDGAR